MILVLQTFRSSRLEIVFANTSTHEVSVLKNEEIEPGRMMTFSKLAITSACMFFSSFYFF